MAHVLVIGASKGIGLETVKYGLERGHHMRAFARSADEMEIDAPELEKRSGDATDASDVEAALDGVDAVAMTLGVSKGPELLYKKFDLFSKATEILLPAMDRLGVSRLVVVTGFGAGDSREKLSFVERIPFKIVLERAYDDKDVQEDMIRRTTLDWTIARPGILHGGQRTGRYRVLVDPGSWHHGIISRADVAHFIITAIEENGYLRQTPALVR